MNKIPDFIARPSDIKNYFGSNANVEAYIKKISKGIAQTSQNFYEHLNDAREEASVPPMLFVFMIDITKKYKFESRWDKHLHVKKINEFFFGYIFVKHDNITSFWIRPQFPQLYVYHGSPLRVYHL